MSDGKLDFDGLARALLPYAREFVPAWLPGGKMSGREYVVGSLRGEPGESLSVNMDTGRWADFAGDAKGGDLISLYAAIENIGQGDAARRLAQEINYTTLVPERRPEPEPKPEPKVEPPPKPEAVLTAPPPDVLPPSMECRFGKPTQRWGYKNADGLVMFYIARYDPEEGRKQFVPWSWDAANKRWTMKSWPAPRPLYGLDLLAANKEKPVLIVEGEKAALAARKFVNAYVVVTWPGGAKATGKTDLAPLHGRSLLLWPDADEPGIFAMTEIARQLKPNCPEIKVLNVDGMPDGWDAADAFEGGWKWEQFAAWAKPRARLYVEAVEGQLIAKDAPPAEPEEEGPSDVPTSLYATWERLGVATSSNGAPICNVDNALRVIEGWRDFKDLVWFDVFHQKILTRWKSEIVREWTDIDDLMICQFMQRNLGLRRISDEMIHKAIKIYAHARQRNEPRDWMQSLKWDEQPRIDAFFAEYMGVVDSPYARAVGKNFWIGMIARIYQPGCQLDNMIILEGPQGAFKSTSLRIIGGPWFTEAQGALIGSPDFYMELRGKLVVEIGELSSFSKAEISTIKQVVTSPTDRYRSPYGRSPQDHPRMSIFVGSTNEQEYLRDNTGGRRFWPIRCGRIDKDKITQDRNQLFAEAVARFHRGESWYQVPPEALVEQEERRQVDEWESIIEQFLIGKQQVQISDIGAHMKIDASRLGMPEQRRIGGILRLLKWERKSARVNGLPVKAWFRDPLENPGQSEDLPLKEEPPF